jgi:hypothetical protein
MRRTRRCCHCCTAHVSIMQTVLLWCHISHRALPSCKLYCCGATCPARLHAEAQAHVYSIFPGPDREGELLQLVLLRHQSWVIVGSHGDCVRPGRCIVRALHMHCTGVVRASECPGWCSGSTTCYTPHAALLKQIHRRGLICSHPALSLRCVIMYRTTFRGRLALASQRRLWFWPLSCSWLGRRATHTCHRQRGTAAPMPALHEHCMSRPAASGLTSTRHLTLQKICVMLHAIQQLLSVA